jgi:hypothetical protein
MVVKWAPASARHPVERGPEGTAHHESGALFRQFKRKKGRLGRLQS